MAEQAAAAAGLGETLAAVREQRPLVHCLTATVSMQRVADALLAAGARPMMTETALEAPAMVRLADALLVNLGTLSSDGLAGIPPTVAEARALESPWLLDPTAVGPAPARTSLARQLLDERPVIVRGNASEILALAGGPGGRGADSVDDAAAPEVLAAARRLAGRTGGWVAVSGERDLLTDGSATVRVHGGTPLLTRITGAGCALGALTAACAAVTDPGTAAATASAWVALAGQRAAARTGGPGSFAIAWLDELAALTPDDLDREVRLT